jgi:hypothetical protein
MARWLERDSAAGGKEYHNFFPDGTICNVSKGTKGKWIGVCTKKSSDVNLGAVGDTAKQVTTAINRQVRRRRRGRR